MGCLLKKTFKALPEAAKKADGLDTRAPSFLQKVLMLIIIAHTLVDFINVLLKK